MIKNRYAFLVSLLFALTFSFSVCAEDDIFSDYTKHLKKLQDSCDKINELVKKRDHLQEQERSQRRAERDARRDSNDDDDDYDDDDDDREQYRRRRRQIAEQRKKLQDQLNEARESLSYDFTLHEQLAKEMQHFLNNNGITGDFSFEQRSKDITKIFKSHGIGFDNEKGVNLRHSSVLDPA